MVGAWGAPGIRSVRPKKNAAPPPLRGFSRGRGGFGNRCGPDRRQPERRQAMDPVWRGVAPLAGMALRSIAACQGDSAGGPAALTVRSGLVVIPSSPPPVQPGVVWLCLNAPAGSYPFTVSQQAESGGTVG